MRLVVTAAAVLMASPAFSGDPVSPGAHGALTGHDGKQWVMEGCAAYPVTAGTAPTTQTTGTLPSSSPAGAVSTTKRADTIERLKAKMQRTSG